jgi:hypothetical protein
VSAPSNTGAVAGAPRWVKTFGIVMLLLLVVFVALHMTGRQLGGHMPSGAHQQHMSGAGSP